MANRFLSNIRINDAYTFPASDGSFGQAIVTDGAGNLSFGDVASGGGGDAASVIFKDNFTGDGVETAFSMARGVTSEDQTQIYIDGVYQQKDTYSISGNVITFSEAPISGHSIEVMTLAGITVGPTTIYQDNFTGNGSTTDFTLANSVNNEIKTLVFLNGVYQFKGTYNITGTTLSFDAPPADGTLVEVITLSSVNAQGVEALYVSYDNEDSTLLAENVKNALDELDANKVNITDLAANVVFYPTTAASGITDYYLLVDDIEDPDYNSTAVDITTPEITGQNQLIAQLATAPGKLVGNTGVINIHTIGNIRRSTGVFSGQANFYYEVYKRDSSGTETLLATSSTTQAVTSSTYEEFYADALIQNASFTATDRVVFKYYGNQISGSAEYDLQFGGGSPIRSLFPVPVSVIPLKDLNALSDVDIDGVADGNLLAYNNTTSNWENTDEVQVKVVEAIIFQTPKNFTQTYTMPENYNGILIGPTTLEGNITVPANSDLTVL